MTTSASCAEEVHLTAGLCMPAVRPLLRAVMICGTSPRTRSADVLFLVESSVPVEVAHQHVPWVARVRQRLREFLHERSGGSGQDP